MPPFLNKEPSRSLSIDWGQLAPLRLRAKAISDGMYAGSHRSIRKGSGVEFGGYRPYQPGDDLRFLDRRSLLRHDRLMVREFETELDRVLWICLDATASMAYRSAAAPAAKLAFAGLLASGLARVALATGDPVGLTWIGGGSVRGFGPHAGPSTFARITSSIEEASAGGDISNDNEAFARALEPVVRRARRGSIVVLFSDLFDLPPDAMRSFASLAAADRFPVVVSIVDPAERHLPFRGNLRFKSMEGSHEIETDAELIRTAYRGRLKEHLERWSEYVSSRGGKVVLSSTDDDPMLSLRAIVRAIDEAPA